MDEKPAVVFTLDFELGWGSIENGKWAAREAKGVYTRLRKLIPELADTFSRLEIPSTWGIVGAMNESPGTQQLEHLPSHLRELTRKTLKEGRAQTFDGRDLIEELAKENCYISLCSHTYSHTRVDAFGGNEKLFEQEMRQFERSTKQLPIEKKMIFPQNIESFYNVLDVLGYKKVRGSEIFIGQDNYLSKIKRNILVSPPTSRFSKVNENLRRETGSLYYSARNSSQRRLLLNLQLKRGLRKILYKNETLHIYTHPLNFAEDEKLYNNYIYFLDYVAKMKKQNKLRALFF